MMTKSQLIAALGGKFTTKKLVAEVLHYKRTESVTKYFEGLAPVSGRTYWTEEVAERIMNEMGANA